MTKSKKSEASDRDESETLKECAIHASVVCGLLRNDTEGRSSDEIGSDHWEHLALRGANEPDRVITGVVVRYPGQFVAYLEGSELGLGKAISTGKELMERKSSRLLRIKVLFTCFNIKARLFGNLTSRAFSAPAPSPSPRSSARSREAPPREALIRVVLRLASAVRGQGSMSIKKALDLISEKFSHLLPSAAAIEAAVVAVREEGPLDARIILCLDEEIVWPAPAESFLLKVSDY